MNIMYNVILMKVEMIVPTRRILISRNGIRLLQRSLTTTSTNTMRGTDLELLPPELKALKKKQARFTMDDGKRVHEKGGWTDKVLYQFTSLVMIVGCFEACRIIWTLCYPDWETFLTKKPKTI